MRRKNWVLCILATLAILATASASAPQVTGERIPPSLTTGTYPKS